MKCRNCKRTIVDNSLFCNWCGAKQTKEKNEYHISKPTKRNGYYSGRIVVDGHKVTIKADTEKEYFQKVTEIKSGKPFKQQPPTLKKAIENYINSNSQTLSPSTLRGYDQIIRCRFQDYMFCNIDVIDYQRMINDEAKTTVSPKTIKNAWGLVSASLRYAGYNRPHINLPKVPLPETDFLDHKQVKVFLKAIEGEDCEIPALLALHSLRASEMYHLTTDDIRNKIIRIHGATVRDKNNKWVDKDTNKNRNSTREIPVIIPRLLKIIPKSGSVVTIKQTTVREHLEDICRKNDLPICSLHDLRRTFASLAAYLQWQEETICAVGGWRQGSPIVHDIYIKTSNTAIKEDISKMTKFLKSDT